MEDSQVFLSFVTLGGYMWTQSPAWIRKGPTLGEELADCGLVHLMEKRTLDSFNLLIHEDVKGGTP